MEYDVYRGNTCVAILYDLICDRCSCLARFLLVFESMLFFMGRSRISGFLDCEKAAIQTWIVKMGIRFNNHIDVERYGEIYTTPETTLRSEISWLSKPKH